MIKVETVYLWIMGDIVVTLGLCEWKCELKLPNIQYKIHLQD